MSVSFRNLRPLAEPQHGYFTAKQAKMAGFSKCMHFYHCKTGNWIKYSNGLFRLLNFKDSLESEFVRCSLWSRNNHDQPQGVISHQSALALRGLGDYDPQNIHLTVPIRFRKKVPAGVIIHHASLNLSTIESRAGFLVTRMLRTLEDLRSFLEENGSWKEVIERALESGRLSREEAILLGSEIKMGSIGVREIAPSETSESARKEALVGAGDGTDTRLSTDSKAQGYIHPIEAGSASAVSQNILASSPKARESGDHRSSELMRERIYNMIFQRTHAGSLSRRRTQAGFTLVELLVVMAIVSVLAGMLLPVLGNAVDSARQISCMNNLKQVIAATQLYAGDNGDWIWNIGYIPSTCYDTWAEALSGGRNYKQSEYLSRNEIFCCPSSSVKKYSGSGMGKFQIYGMYRRYQDTEYAIKHYANYAFVYMEHSTLIFYKLDNFPQPANFILHADSISLDYNATPYWHFSPSKFIENGGIHTIHAGLANCSFPDGHAASIGSMKMRDSVSQVKVYIDQNHNLITIP